MSLLCRFSSKTSRSTFFRWSKNRFAGFSFPVKSFYCPADIGSPRWRSLIPVLKRRNYSDIEFPFFFFLSLFARSRVIQFRSEKVCFEASVFIPRGRLFFFFFSYRGCLCKLKFSFLLRVSFHAFFVHLNFLRNKCIKICLSQLLGRYIAVNSNDDNSVIIRRVYYLYRSVIHELISKVERTTIIILIFRG